MKINGYLDIHALSNALLTNQKIIQMEQDFIVMLHVLLIDLLK